MNKIGFNRFHNIEDIRKNRDAEYSSGKKDLYDSLINLILNHKVELKKVPLASSLNTATTWAAKRGLRAGEVDLNKDGHPETVIYNKAGQPTIINGYKVAPSDYPIRHEYYSRFPNREDRIGNPISGWVKNAAYRVEKDPNNPWKRSVTKTTFGSKLKEWGYKMPTKPKKSFSVFSIFSKLIAPIVREYLDYDNGLCGNIFGQNGGPSCVQLLRKLISPITLYRALYMKIVERPYFLQLVNDGILSNYKAYKQYVKDHPSRFWSYFASSFLSDDLEHFKEGVITPQVVAGHFVKGSCEWDGSDPDDIIVFMIGLENIRNEEFSSFILNEDNAKELLSILKGGKSADRTRAARNLEKWKVKARASQKALFKDLIVQVFQNQGAHERFNEAIQEGSNPFTNAESTEERQAIAAPVEVRTVENGTAEHLQAPGSIPSPIKVGNSESNGEMTLEELEAMIQDVQARYDAEQDAEKARELRKELDELQAAFEANGGVLPHSDLEDDDA